jgi:hypothetical protein
MSTLKTNAIQTVAGKPILNSTGSILQTVYVENTTQYSLATTQSYQVFYSSPITATANSSRYLLIGNTHSWNGTANGRCNMGYSVTISGVTTRIAGVDGGSGDAWGYPSGAGYVGCYMNRQAIYTSTAVAGTVLTFNFLVAQWEGTGTYNYTGHSHKSTFTVMEISS